MNARDDIINQFSHNDRTNRELNDLLDAYAHELAEEIRNSEWLIEYTDDHMSDCNAAADLIDPEVR